MTTNENAAEWVEIEKLHGWEKNPKKHPDAQVKDLMKSIKRFGWGAVILARPNGEVIAGHGRLEAAKRLKMPRVPVRYLDLDPGEAHLLALADNKLTEVSEWDDKRVREILAKARDEGALIDGLGWSDDELVKLLEPTDETPPELDTSSQLGDGLQFRIVIDCNTEEEQAALLERLEQEGLQCHALIS
jgi:ParB-like chromosome segregation protein Spo0J